MVALSYSLSSTGDRITYCRSSLNLTRKDLSKRWGGASIPTLARWELNTVNIPKKKLESLVDFFNESGLLVNFNWIENGEGVPPVNLGADIFNELDFDTLAQENFLIINQKKNNFCFGQVKNNILSPLVKYGDYVGGIKEFDKNNLSLNGEFIFVLDNDDMFVGICSTNNDSLSLEGIRGTSENLKPKKIDAVGKILCLMRRP